MVGACRVAAAELSGVGKGSGLSCISDRGRLGCFGGALQLGQAW